MKTSTCRRVCLLALISFVLLGSVLSGREEIVLAEEITVAPRQAQEFSFPVQDAELRQIRLSLDVRLDWGTLGGYTSGMSIAVNGQKVAGKRLLNKPLKCRLRNGSILQWADQDGTGFIVMYAGNFSDEILTNQHYIYGIVEEGQDPFRFVFDLSGLTTHNIDNKIVVSPNHSVGLVLANVKVEFDEAAMPRINDTAAAVIPAPEGDLPDFSFYTPKRHSPALKKADDGILIFEFHGHDYPVAGRFSLPDGNWCEAGTGSGMWRTSAQPQKMVLTTNSYRLIRKVKIREGYVKITDTFENLTDAVVGIIFANSLHLPEIPQRILRGGKETELKQTGSNSNPSIVAEMPDSSVTGIVLEDDISRNQHYLEKGEKLLRVGNRRLGLPPKGTHTLEWSIFFLADGDYYDFINDVRRAWHINFTMHGPLAFPRSEKITDWNTNNVTPNFIRTYLQQNPVKLVMTHVPTSPVVARARTSIENPWIGHGTAAPQFDWWCGRTAALVKTMHEVAPEVEVYAYLHKNLCSEPGYPAKYRDSVALDGDGRERRAGQLGLFLPTVNNSYGQALADVYQFIVSELGAHIYLDEICLSVTAAAPYAEWDNCTVEIDMRTHAVIRQLSLPNLLVQPWLEEMISYLQRSGKKLLANGPPATRTLQKHRIQHFVEAGAGESGLIAAHLATPLAWQGYVTGLPAYRHFKESLNHGALTITWSGVWSDHLFPFTPLELRPGYVVGEERIVTRLSGIFGWGDKSAAEFKMYDGEGVPVPAPGITTVETERAIAYEVRMPSDHAAVIIRKKQ